MRRPDADARRVLQAFAGAGLRARAHTTVRWWTCPFAEVERFVPDEGRVLDLGCGHGAFSAYLAARAAGRQVVGIDIDTAKVGIGRQAVERAGLAGRVDLLSVGPDWRAAPGGYDAIVVTDVLYLLGRERAGSLLDLLAAAVRPGGVVVVKEVGAEPRWKHRINAVQEVLATRVLRITAGDALDVVPVGDIEARLHAAGLDVRTTRLDQGYLHPHVAVVGTRR